MSGDPGYRTARDRAAAFRQALDEAGVPLVGGPRFGQWSQRWGRQAAAGLPAAHPDVDAIFCGSGQVAYGVTEVLRELGRDIPDDVTVVASHGAIGRPRRLVLRGSTGVARSR
ncbi:substrate-binding domain-containing protein [Saccharothrix syringae]|uniref:substrate-binding domain-containing protein n=1 Tax=Saccharothrix syringae TaxID=103733 RepID=UPI002010A094|nr:substrate-binding domain-containing protein [Saccharothrix syringae]